MLSSAKSLRSFSTSDLCEPKVQRGGDRAVEDTKLRPQRVDRLLLRSLPAAVPCSLPKSGSKTEEGGGVRRPVVGRVFRSAPCGGTETEEGESDSKRGKKATRGQEVKWRKMKTMVTCCLKTEYSA
eukprot:754143-Hanusia_phi.AAC.1